jgi:hypothetical protein
MKKEGGCGRCDGGQSNMLGATLAIPPKSLHYEHALCGFGTSHPQFTASPIFPQGVVHMTSQNQSLF